LEYGYSKALLEQTGHEAEIIDAQMEGLTLDQVRERVTSFRPDVTVITTAPSYLFWRCPPPELRVPLETADAVRDIAGMLAVVGPHASTTPDATRRKLKADVVVVGECEELLPSLAAGMPIAAGRNGAPHASDVNRLPALHWPRETITRHAHHHHRFDARPPGPGAEMETSRGCPYHCTFCAKENFRNAFRRRPLAVIEEELDGLIDSGATYIYFIDEIFLPFQDVLDAVGERKIPFGIQTRIDLWSPAMIDKLGRAGCVSIEAGVESITESGRELLDKRCKLSTEEITARLIQAKQVVSFVQANLMDSDEDDAAAVEAWRERLQAAGVWANRPVPMFPYPGSPDYTKRWGAPNDSAWERAHDAYLNRFQKFSDIQEQRPLSLIQLEERESNV
jgi:B12-binding domain/radical SAM domain protein of rhizo-twelve system